jgi:hypothetical protein
MDNGDAELIRRLTKAAWFFGGWTYLVAAYFVFGFLLSLSSFESQASGFGLLYGVFLAVASGPVVGFAGLLFSFPTLIAVPVYLALLRHLPRRVGPRAFRLTAIVLAPPVVGSLTFAWWWSTGFGAVDPFFTPYLVAVLLIYGFLIPSPFADSRRRRFPPRLSARRLDRTISQQLGALRATTSP